MSKISGAGYTITGVRSLPPMIKIHDQDRQEVWSWSPWEGAIKVGAGEVPLWASTNLCWGRSVTEVKWGLPEALDGKEKIVAIVNYAAIVLDVEHKTLDFVAEIESSHTLALLPGGFLAVATSDKTQNDGIDIYDIVAYSSSQSSSPKPVQRITGFPAIHGLVFDRHSQKLWAAGNDLSPADNGNPSTPVLKAFAFMGRTVDSAQYPIERGTVRVFSIAQPAQLDIEWGDTQYKSWWNGAHDLIPVPNKRTLLITSDLDVHTFDIETFEFKHGNEVISEIMPGFKPVGERTAKSGQSLPRSDIKAISVDSAGNYLYVQAEWHDWFANQVRIINVQNELRPFDLQVPQQVYKSRWFGAVAGW